MLNIRRQFAAQSAGPYPFRLRACDAADNAARIAGLFHLLQHGTTGQVNESDMQAACSLAMWHLSESRRFLAAVSQPAELSLAIKLDDWLIKRAMQQQASTFSRTSLMQYVPNQLRKKTILFEALETLIEADRIRQFDDGNISMIEVNPQLLGGATWV